MHDMDDWATSDEKDPQSLMISQERADAIKKAINSLPSKGRKILMLWSEGTSYREIAEQYNISIHTVNTHISRMKQKLRIDLVGL